MLKFHSSFSFSSFSKWMYLSVVAQILYHVYFILIYTHLLLCSSLLLSISFCPYICQIFNGSSLFATLLFVANIYMLNKSLFINLIWSHLHYLDRMPWCQDCQVYLFLVLLWIKFSSDLHSKYDTFIISVHY